MSLQHAVEEELNAVAGGPARQATVLLALCVSHRLRIGHLKRLNDNGPRAGTQNLRGEGTPRHQHRQNCRKKSAHDRLQSVQDSSGWLARKGPAEERKFKENHHVSKHAASDAHQ